MLRSCAYFMISRVMGIPKPIALRYLKLSGGVRTLRDSHTTMLL